MDDRRKVVIVDDNQSILDQWSEFISERYDNLEILAFRNPLDALPFLTEDVHLCLLDLEMPNMDGLKMLEYAAEKGVRRNRTIILSARDANTLHKLFPHGACLAVINKTDPRQQTAFCQILDSIMRRKT